MRRNVTAGLVLLLSASVGMAGTIREPGDMLDITAPVTEGEARGWQDWEETYRDDVESLTPGPLDGQMNIRLQTWSSYDATVEGEPGSQFISQTNTFADGYFFAEVASTLPPTPGPFVFGVDGTLSDLNTDRFYTPTDNLMGQIFTRVGDADHDGFWEVLQLDGDGNPYFADTGVALPLPLSPFRLDILINGSALEVFVDQGSIFAGTVVDTGLFGGPGLSSTLTSVSFESANNLGGANSVATYDNVTIAVPELATIGFVGFGIMLASLTVLRRFA
ncbi:MAG: hypothetical protein KAV82_05725 [Phycisphaerae bacterium]|nr:hypothetical protein [Phycisphaerae bacterium]